jgi:hypothetical protein
MYASLPMGIFYMVKSILWLQYQPQLGVLTHQVYKEVQGEHSGELGTCLFIKTCNVKIVMNIFVIT